MKTITPTKTVCYAEPEGANIKIPIAIESDDGLVLDNGEWLALWEYHTIKRIIVREELV